MSLLKRIQKAWNNYLTRMAKANKELFGNEAPDCCKLNSNQANGKR